MSRIIKLYEKFIEKHKGFQKVNEEWMPTVPYFEVANKKDGYIFEVRKYRNGATGLFCITSNYTKKEPVSELLFILEMEDFEISEGIFYLDDIDSVVTREGTDKYLIFTHVDDVAAPAFRGIGYIPQNTGPDFDAEYGRKMYKLNRPFRIKVVDKK